MVRSGFGGRPVHILLLLCGLFQSLDMVVAKTTEAEEKGGSSEQGRLAWWPVPRATKLRMWLKLLLSKTDVLRETREGALESLHILKFSVPTLVTHLKKKKFNREGKGQEVNPLPC